MRKLLFLPGAGGSADFWQPVARLLPTDWQKVHFSWPGLGDEPADPTISSIDDLVQLVEAGIDGPVDLVAQSMGGPVAVRIALGKPDLVRRLILVVTSAGADMSRFQAADWRPDYRTLYPSAAEWITQQHAAEELAVDNIQAPTLLIWGDADPISPMAIGQHLEARIPHAKLHIVKGGDHDLASNKAVLVAALIAKHLQ